MKMKNLKVVQNHLQFLEKYNAFRIFYALYYLCIIFEFLTYILIHAPGHNLYFGI